MTIKLKHDDIEVPDNDPFSNDELGRRESAEILTQFLERIREPYVLAIDSPWGTGKTTFVRMLRQHLINEGFPTLYFNAWNSDFASDPFVSLVGEVANSILQLTGDEPETMERLKRAAINIAKRGIPVATRIITRSAVDLDEYMEHELAGLAGQIAADQLKDYTTGKKTIESFRQELETAVTKLDGDNPLIFFVDELDRCRPTYAIELLEKAKHLFSVNGIVFVLSVDGRQLESSIRAVYGADCDARGYLRRFIDMKYILHKPPAPRFVKFMCEQLGINSSLRRIGEIHRPRYGIEDLAPELFNLFGCSLRSQLQVLTRINTALHTMQPSLPVYEIELTLFAILQDQLPDLVTEFRAGNLNHTNVVNAIEEKRGGKEFLESELGILVESVLAIGFDQVTDSTSAQEAYQNSEDSHDHEVAGVMGHMLRENRARRFAMHNSLRRLSLAEKFVSYQSSGDS